jgi:ribosomal protein S27AE
MPFSPALPYAHDRVLGRPSCPRCGRPVVLAEATEFSALGQIRNAWRCDDCEHRFETAIRLKAG